jgi:hypothetical protein
MNQHIPFMNDGSLNNGILLVKVVPFYIPIELPEGSHRPFLVALPRMEPGRLRYPNPELVRLQYRLMSRIDGTYQYHQPDRHPKDSHSQQVVVGSCLVELLHH